MKSPTVSVVIPTRNRAAMLREAINSVRAQRFQDWELIVVDDGSSDDTPEVVHRLAAQDERIRYERLPGCGVAQARNHGLALARGWLLGFLDDDDLWVPDKLSAQRRLLGSHPSYGFVYSPVTVWRAGLIDATDVRPRLKPESTYQNLLKKNFITTTSPLVRRDCLEHVGGFDPALRQAADYDLWLRLARRFEFGVTEEPLVIYRLHGENMTVTAGCASYQEHIAIFTKVLQDPALPAEDRRLAIRRLAKEWYLLGRAHWALGQHREAAAAFAKSVCLDAGVGASFIEPNDRWPVQLWKMLKPYAATGRAGLASVALR